MPSFPPHCTHLNAMTCCANSDCRNKEAELLTLKMCTACRSVSYCNVDCQKAHRKIHKHECNEIAKEKKEWLLGKHHSDDDIDDDDELFQPIPPQDECPICTLPLPIETRSKTYQICCGNFLCNGCCEEDSRVTIEQKLIERCPFCREPTPSSEKEVVDRINRRMEMNDSVAIFNFSFYYHKGKFGLPKDPQKAFEFCLRAAELGNSDARGRAAGYYYKEGVVVPKNIAKSREYLEKSAKKGGIISRHNLGNDESKKGNYRLASRHWLISAAAGSTHSMEMVAQFYGYKFVTKKEYFNAFTSYKNVQKDAWSIERKRVVAATL